ncbi:MAG: flagellar hook-length control protein FliK [Pseudomonadota bacterium]
MENLLLLLSSDGRSSSKAIGSPPRAEGDALGLVASVEFEELLRNDKAGNGTRAGSGIESFDLRAEADLPTATGSTLIERVDASQSESSTPPETTDEPDNSAGTNDSGISGKLVSKKPFNSAKEVELQLQVTSWRDQELGLVTDLYSAADSPSIQEVFRGAASSETNAVAGLIWLPKKSAEGLPAKSDDRSDAENITRNAADPTIFGHKSDKTTGLVELNEAINDDSVDRGAETNRLSLGSDNSQISDFFAADLKTPPAQDQVGLAALAGDTRGDVDVVNKTAMPAEGIIDPARVKKLIPQVSGISEQELDRESGRKQDGQVSIRSTEVSTMQVTDQKTLLHFSTGDALSTLGQKAANVELLNVPELLSERSMESPVRIGSESDLSAKASAGGALSTEPKAGVSVANQVVQSISRTQGDGVIEIRLQPEELGRVRITLSTGEVGVQVQILAERAETLDAMKRNIDLIANDLRDRGFGEPTFSFGSGDTDSSAENEDESEVLKEPGNVPRVQNHMVIDLAKAEYIVGSNRIDIRI